MTVTKIQKLVPDTSVLIEGLVSHKILKKELQPKVILIHEAVLAELEHQANLNKDIGYLGLDELDKIKEIQGDFKFDLQFSGRKPSAVEIKHAHMGEIDAMIRELAFEEDATLFTADKVQARVAKAKGMKHLFAEIEQIVTKLKLEKFFDEETMSVHLKEQVIPVAKRGKPGAWQFVTARKKAMTRDEIKDMHREILEEAAIRKDAFIEIERRGSTIAQIGKYRIVITKPPFSDGWEITAVRPVKRLGLPDYKLSEKLMKRIGGQAEGILIAGAPGHGKTTFAQGLADFYVSLQKIVKTIEAPRDLVLPDSITQYAISHGSPQEIHDIMLLSRPDYTIFDEMRNTADFKLFSDLRLAGVGLAGVVHATNPVDAIQRFIGRIELGMIPQIVDTVIFIKNGGVGKVLSLSMTVKVPEGMTEADLARPVVTVTDFETGRLEYELYSYGEETVVIPVKDTKKMPSHGLAEKQIAQYFRKYTDDIEVEILSDHKARVSVPEQLISKIIGKQGATIERIEEELGIGIDVQELKQRKTGKFDYQVEIKKNNILFYVGTKHASRDFHIYVDDDYLLTAKAGKTGVIRIKKNNKIGKILMKAITMKENIRLEA